MTTRVFGPRLNLEHLEARDTPATFTVTSTSDVVAGDGVLTLREAMVSIWKKYDPTNAGIPALVGVPVADWANTINFDIEAAQTGAVEILLTAPLPAFYDRTTINGYSQLGPNGAVGAKRNTAVFGSNADIRIGINGAQLPAGQATGFRSSREGGVNSYVGRALITGLSLYGFADVAINLSSVGYRSFPNNQFGDEYSEDEDAVRESNVQVSGNFIGVKPDGATLGTPMNGVGILSTRSSQVVVGGPTRGDRNVISNSVTDGIRIENQTNTTAQLTLSFSASDV